MRNTMNGWWLHLLLGRIKVEDQVPVRFQRMDQRASSTLLASLPDAVRREIAASESCNGCHPVQAVHHLSTWRWC